MKADGREQFLAALQQAQRGFYFDAIESFQAVVRDNPSGALADDATFNIGVCYMKIRQHAKAIEAFEKVLSDYPDGIIESELPGNEYGRTAAKALLGLVEASLLLNKKDEADKHCKALRSYSDSFVLMPDTGQKVLFYELAKTMIETC